MPHGICFPCFQGSRYLYTHIYIYICIYTHLLAYLFRLIFTYTYLHRILPIARVIYINPQPLSPSSSPGSPPLPPSARRPCGVCRVSASCHILPGARGLRVELGREGRNTSNGNSKSSTCTCKHPCVELCSGFMPEHGRESPNPHLPEPKL